MFSRQSPVIALPPPVGLAGFAGSPALLLGHDFASGMAGMPGLSPGAMPMGMSQPGLSSSPSGATLGAGIDRPSLDAPSTPCTCCRPPPPASSARQPVQVLNTFADPRDLGEASDDAVPGMLQRILGPEGLHKVFGRADAAGARRIHCRGLNHVFMVAHGGRLAKCIRPQTEQLSEAREAERLRRASPGLMADEHAVFPLAAFLCVGAPGAPPPQQPYEITVFEYLDGCHSVGDLVRMFERTHPAGCLQSTASCTGYRNSGTCEHVAQLGRLVVNQVARLGARFQALHGRRHGDLKADNVLIDRRGVLRVADFLSPFCGSCDREEFISSVSSLHPAIRAMQGAFDNAWQVESQRVHDWMQGAPVLDRGDASGNAAVAESLDQLAAASRSQPLFGPMPSLLSSLGLTPPAGFDGSGLANAKAAAAAAMASSVTFSAGPGSARVGGDASPKKPPPVLGHSPFCLDLPAARGRNCGAGSLTAPLGAPLDASPLVGGGGSSGSSAPGMFGLDGAAAVGPGLFGLARLCSLDASPIPFLGQSGPGACAGGPSPSRRARRGGQSTPMLPGPSPLGAAPAHFDFDCGAHLPAPPFAGQSSPTRGLCGEGGAHFAMSGWPMPQQPPPMQHRHASPIDAGPAASGSARRPARLSMSLNWGSGSLPVGQPGGPATGSLGPMTGPSLVGCGPPPLLQGPSSLTSPAASPSATMPGPMSLNWLSGGGGAFSLSSAAAAPGLSMP